MKSSHSHQSLLSPQTLPTQGRARGRNRVLSCGNSKPSKPPPPSRPPPANSKLSQLISDHRSRSQSTLLSVTSKGQSSTATRVKPAISEPQLISTTIRSDSQSLTDLRIQQDKEVEENDIEFTASTNISYVATSDLLGEDRSSPVYEDIDAVIPLPPTRNDRHKPKVTPPMGRKSFSVDDVPPELPPKECHSDPIGRRRGRRRRTPPSLPPKSPLTNPLSTSSSVGTAVSSPDSPTDREEEENRDIIEAYYVKKITAAEDEEGAGEAAVQDTGAYEMIRSPSLSGGEETQEPDVCGVDEYVAMEPVISTAWETDNSESHKTKEGKEKSSCSTHTHTTHTNTHTHSAQSWCLCSACSLL